MAEKKTNVLHSRNHNTAEYANLKIDVNKDGGIDKAFKGYLPEIVSIHNEIVTWKKIES